jgi:asparagine synthase (glutamine-hydrolysing)
LGTSLSGGLDSSSIVSAICNAGLQHHTLKTFSAVFPGFTKDESKYIELVTQRYGLESYTVTPTADGFIKDLEKLLYHQEEPVSSMSVYAQFKVFELAKSQDVKVLLDGQGVDELMAGYGKHIQWYLMQLLASGHRKEMKVIGEALHRNKVNFQWGWENYIGIVWPRATSKFLTQRAARGIRQHPFITKDFIHAHLQKDLLLRPVVKTLNDILYADTFQNVLPDLLRYADRNSMAHSREVRLPYLNHSLAEFLFSLPPSYKIHDGYSKYILRTAMMDLLPSDITWRKDKTAFEPPQKEWMENSDLQEYIHEAKKTLVEKRILREPVLNEKIQPLDAHAAGNYDWRYLVVGYLLR